MAWRAMAAALSRYFHPDHIGTDGGGTEAFDATTLEHIGRGVATILRRRGHGRVPVLLSCETSDSETPVETEALLEVRNGLCRGLVLGGFVVEDVSPVPAKNLFAAAIDVVGIGIGRSDAGPRIEVCAAGQPLTERDYEEMRHVCEDNRLAAGVGQVRRGSLEDALTRIIARNAAGFENEGTDPAHTQVDNTAVE